MKDDIISKLASENARLIALHKIVFKEDILDIKILNNLLQGLEKVKKFYLASSLSSKIADLYKKKYNEEFINSETTQSELKHLKKHRKNAIFYLKKQFVYIERSALNLKREYLHIKNAYDLKLEAQSFFQTAKKLEEQAKLLKGKSISLKSSYSKYAARFNKKKAFMNFKESYYLKECALKLLESSMASFKIAGMPGDVLQIRKLFQEYNADFLASKSGASRALKYALKSGCFNLASIYAEKKGDHQLAKSLKDEYNTRLKEIKDQAFIFEGKAKSCEKHVGIGQKNLLELDERTKDLKTKNVIKRIFLGLLYFFKHRIISRIKRKNSGFADEYFTQAKLNFLDSQLFGKASEIEKKKDNIIKSFEDLVIIAEKARLSGEISAIYKVNASFASIVALCQKSKNKTLLVYIRRKERELAFVIRKTHEADKLEITSDNASDDHRKQKLMHNAMLIYEDIGFFSLAKEIAVKIQDADRVHVYQKIL